MAVVAPSLNEQIESRQGSMVREAKRFSLAAGDTTQPVLLSRFPARVRIMPGATSTAKVQYTTSPPSMVTADTAVWDDWANGDATNQVNESEVIEGPLTALRGSCSAGTAIMEVVF